MSDIVERLRNRAYEFYENGEGGVDELSVDAVREIDRLRGLLREVRVTLPPMHTEYPKGDCCDAHRLLERIDAALGEGK